LNVEVCVESWEARIMFDVKEMQPRYIGGGMLIDGLLQLLDERRACLDTLVINSDTFIGILQTDSVPNYIPVARQVKLVNEALVTKKSLMRVKEGGQLTCTSVSLATNVSTAADIQAAIAQWGSAKDGRTRIACMRLRAAIQTTTKSTRSTGSKSATRDRGS
jgi:hypothetical protein